MFALKASECWRLDISASRASIALRLAMYRESSTLQSAPVLSPSPSSSINFSGGRAEWNEWRDSGCKISKSFTADSLDPASNRSTLVGFAGLRPCNTGHSSLCFKALSLQLLGGRSSPTERGAHRDCQVKWDWCCNLRASSMDKLSWEAWKSSWALQLHQTAVLQQSSIGHYAIYFSKMI